jgi:hypothetical protein
MLSISLKPNRWALFCLLILVYGMLGGVSIPQTSRSLDHFEKLHFIKILLLCGVMYFGGAFCAALVNHETLVVYSKRLAEKSHRIYWIAGGVFLCLSGLILRILAVVAAD